MVRVFALRAGFEQLTVADRDTASVTFTLLKHIKFPTSSESLFRR
jgi:hypothetical protein